MGWWRAYVIYPARYSYPSKYARPNLNCRIVLYDSPFRISRISVVYYAYALNIIFRLVTRWRSIWPLCLIPDDSHSPFLHPQSEHRVPAMSAIGARSAVMQTARNLGSHAPTVNHSAPNVSRFLEGVAGNVVSRPKAARFWCLFYLFYQEIHKVQPRAPRT